jgi:hypothetical protein
VTFRRAIRYLAHSPSIARERTSSRTRPTQNDRRLIPTIAKGANVGLKTITRAGHPQSSPPATPAATSIVVFPVRNGAAVEGQRVARARMGHVQGAGRQRKKAYPRIVIGTAHQTTGPNTRATAKAGPAIGGYRLGASATSFVPAARSNGYGPVS